VLIRVVRVAIFKMKTLGRGLKSLIPQKNKKKILIDKEEESLMPIRSQRGSIFNIEVEKIHPNPLQPRHNLDKTSLMELAESIKEHGILQPLVVAKIRKNTRRGQETHYQVIAGHRRLEAAKLIKLPHVPAIIRDSTKQQKLELALVENVQRIDLNPIERALAFKKLYDEFGMSHEEIATKIGKARESVTNTMRLLVLPREIQEGLKQGRLTEGHARALITVLNPETQKVLYNEVIQNNLSVRQIEQKVREVAVRSYKRIALDPEIKSKARKLELALGYKVQIKKAGVGGTVIIRFPTFDDLDVVMQKILKDKNK